MRIVETGFDEEVLKDPQRGYFFEKADSKVLLITFGGIQQGIAIPVFEFFRSIQQYEVNKLFIRDFSQSWYNEGVPSIGDDIAAIEQFIKYIIKEYNITKVVVLGNSAGGYAALLLGYLVSADIVHAFAPQTFLDKWNRLKFWDTRWKSQIHHLHKTVKTKSYLDLKTYFSNKEIAGQFNIYYCHKNRLDNIHANRLRNKANLLLHSYSEGGHGVIKHLKETGVLDTILAESIKPIL